MAQGPTLPPGQWGRGPLLPHSFAEDLFMAKVGSQGSYQVWSQPMAEGSKVGKKKGFFGIFGISLPPIFASVSPKVQREVVSGIYRQRIAADQLRLDDRWTRGGIVHNPPRQSAPGAGWWDLNGLWHDR